jgi:hypothetical protein
VSLNEENLCYNKEMVRPKSSNTLGEKMRTQNKENYYYFFWIVAMVAFIVPQVVTAVAYHRIADYLNGNPVKVQVVDK